MRTHWRELSLVAVDSRLRVRFARLCQSADERGCRDWLGCRLKTGYGLFNVKVGASWSSVPAHRIAWLIENGPPGCADVLHRCDNPACQETAHLYLGNATDNGRDMSARGRCAHTKLLPETVVALRVAAKQGVSVVELMDAFGIARRTVGGVICGQSHRHTGGPTRMPNKYTRRA